MHSPSGRVSAVAAAPAVTLALVLGVAIVLAVTITVIRALTRAVLGLRLRLGVVQVKHPSLCGQGSEDVLCCPLTEQGGGVSPDHVAREGSLGSAVTPEGSVGVSACRPRHEMHRGTWCELGVA